MSNLKVSIKKSFYGKLPSPVLADSTNNNTRQSTRLSNKKDAKIYYEESLEPEDTSTEKTIKKRKYENDEDFKLEDDDITSKKKTKNNDSNNSQILSPPFEENKLSDYEKKILDNIAERQKMLQSLGIFEDMNSLKEEEQQQPKKQIVKKTERPTQVRRSRRLLEAISYDELSLSSQSSTTASDCGTYSDSSEIRGVDPGPSSLNTYSHHNDNKANVKFLNSLTIMKVEPSDQYIWRGSDDEMSAQFRSLNMESSGIAKVVSRRIHSLEFLPAKDRLIAVVGGNGGNLGIWDIEATRSEDSLFSYKIHQSPINHLSFDKFNHKSIYTTSYDGTFRTTSLVSLQSQQIYNCNDQDLESYVSWHAQINAHTFIIAGSRGFVDQVDVRSPKEFTRYKLDTNKSTKVVTVHPIESHTIATASNGGLISIWDLRQISKGVSVASTELPKNIYSLQYSPITGKFLLSACGDDKIRVSTFNNDRIRHTTSFHHYNQTGRWLTTFKPKWVPGSENHFTVGSMDRIRNIEMWNTEGDLVHRYNHVLLNSICSLTAVHPYMPAIMGGNSSGKVYLLKSDQ